MKRELTLWLGLSIFPDAAVVIESNRICIILMHFETLQYIQHSDTIIVPAVYVPSAPLPRDYIYTHTHVSVCVCRYYSVSLPAEKK